VLQCVAVCCSVLQCAAVIVMNTTCIERALCMEGVAVCCSVLQCVAVCCSNSHEHYIHREGTVYGGTYTSRETYISKMYTYM